jgi:hypothetical protein
MQLRNYIKWKNLFSLIQLFQLVVIFYKKNIKKFDYYLVI